MEALSNSLLDTNQDPQLWTKHIPDIKHQDPEFQSYALKTSLSGNLEVRFFAVFGHYLCYKRSKSTKKFKGCLDLKFSRIQYSQIEMRSKKASSCKYRVRIIKNLKFTDIFFKTTQNLQQWKSAVNKFTFKTDFHQRYSLINLTSKESTHNVNLIAIIFFDFFDFF